VSATAARAVPDEGPIDRGLLSDNAQVGDDGVLRVAGVGLLELASRYGTPLFVYDEDHVRARCREARSAWGDGVAYATKAFLCKAMARLAHAEGMFLDVSTGGELHVALSAGVAPKRIVLHGNNKDEAELETGVHIGVGRIVVDSFDELDRLGSLLRRAGGSDRLTNRVGILVRVTPGVEAHTHEFVRTGQEDSKFGFGLASGAAAEAVERVRSMPGLELLGVHAHIGSQVFRADSFAEAVSVLAGFANPLRLPELCIGGGLGVAYVAGESAPTITEWASKVREAAREAGIPDTVRLSAEPGRAVVAAAAMTLYTVGTIKELPGIRTYVAVDGGMSDNPRPVLYGSGYETFLPREPWAPRTRAVTVVGKHCETGDVVVSDARVPADIGVGDILATPVTGAYGYSMASNYNKVPRPAVVFVRDGSARVVVRRESLDDLISHDEP
jgi:diaminopimelate decarboxylase